jgi:flagellar hook-length control protein FliK
MIPQGLISIDKLTSPAGDLSSGQKSSAGSKELFSAILASLSNRSGVTKITGGEAILSPADVSTEKRAGIIELVKKYALSKTGNLDTLFIDEKGLKDFEKFLLGAGFDQESVAALMEKLKAKMGGRELKLSDLFQELKNIKDPSEETSETDMLDLSAAPYIESALLSLGISQERISGIIGKATIDGVGIDLERLITALKALKKGALEGAALQGGAHSLTSSGTAANEQRGNDFLTEMMTRLGMKPGSALEKSLTLEDSNSGIESLRMKKERADEMTSLLGMKPVTAKEKNLSLENFISGLESLQTKKENSDEVASLLNADLKRFFEKVRSQPENAAQAQGIGLKEKYLNQGSDKSGAAPDKYSFLNGKNAEASPRESLGDLKSLVDKPVTEKSSLEGKVAARTAEGSAAVSTALKGSGKNLDGAARTTRAEGPLSYSGMIREVNNPDASLGASEAKPAGRTLPMYVMDQVGRQIIRSVNNGENEIRLQIKPPSLGGIHMTIDNTSDGIRISILAENRTTKDLILANANELKVAILDQGIHINEIDVQVSSNFQQAMQDMREKENNSKGHGRGKAEENRERGGPEIVGPLISKEILGPVNGRLDLVA